MQHASWIAQARQHWLEHLPKMYARLKANGTLQQQLTEAAEATARDLQNLMGQGFNYQEAWEQVRETYLFLPEEKGASPEAPVSEGYKTALAINRGLASLRMPGERED